METQRRNLVLPAAILLLAILAVLLGLAHLSRSDPTQTELFLNCTETNRNGWRFETEAGAAQPVFGFGGYLDGVSAEGTGPVAAERVMEDTGARELLQFFCYGAGIEVYLDSKLLYTDFPDAERNENGFLTGVDPSAIGYEGLQLPLGSDCAGKRLRIVTYASADENGLRRPMLPSLVSRMSDAVIQTAAAVWPMTAIAALALLAVSLLTVLLLGAQHGQAQWGLAPLAVYFLLSTLPILTRSFLSTSAGLELSGVLLLLSRLSIDALLCYFAVELSGWRRWALLGGAAVHTGFSALWVFGNLPVSTAQSYLLDFVLFLLALGLMLTSKRTQFRRSALGICGVAAVLFLAFGVCRLLGTTRLYPLTNPVSALLHGDVRAFYGILSALTAFLCAALAVVGFIRSLLQRQRQTDALEARSRMVQENYEQALASAQKTAALRHEWKNHVSVLTLLQRKGDAAGLTDYLARLDDQLEHLSPTSYTANFIVNTVLQRYAAKAKELGASFHATAPLPAELPIDEGDLCGFLFNLLDNAVEGAARTPPDKPRDIRCSLQIRQGYLAIRCENTFDGVVALNEEHDLLTRKPAPADHGYGLLQMRAIAEKYGSTLSVSYDAERFTVMTALKLP